MKRDRPTAAASRQQWRGAAAIFVCVVAAALLAASGLPYVALAAIGVAGGIGIRHGVREMALRTRYLATHARQKEGQFWDFGGVRIGLVGHDLHTTGLALVREGNFRVPIHDVRDVVVNSDGAICVRLLDGSAVVLGEPWGTAESVAAELDHLTVELNGRQRGRDEERAAMLAALARAKPSPESA